VTSNSDKLRDEVLTYLELQQTTPIRLVYPETVADNIMAPEGEVLEVLLGLTAANGPLDGLVDVTDASSGDTLWGGDLATYRKAMATTGLVLDTEVPVEEREVSIYFKLRPIPGEVPSLESLVGKTIQAVSGRRVTFTDGTWATLQVI
jgi:hypothetical protein